MADHTRHGDRMSSADQENPLRLDRAENASFLMDRWTESLAQVLESMTDQRPTIHWEAVSGPLSEVGAEGGYLWWGAAAAN